MSWVSRGGAEPPTYRLRVPSWPYLIITRTTYPRNNPENRSRAWYSWVLHVLAPVPKKMGGITVKFTDEVRQRFPEERERLDQLENFFKQYDDSFRRRCISAEKRPERLWGHNAAVLLLTSLSRARLLTATVIHCVNGGLAPGMYLATRAHWEMTGLVAHLLHALRRFYDRQMSEGDLETTLRRLALGRRWEIPADVKEDISAINAISLVESAAKLLGKEPVETHVMSCYNLLSEHCHPNLLGRLAGVTLSDDLRLVEFDPAFTIHGSDIAVCLSHGLSSHGIFLYAYEECFRLLNEHEEMPTIEA